MNKEDKELLIKDLCVRLYYNVKVDITYSKEHGSSDRLRICSEGCLMLNTDVLGLYIENEIYLKPYLRPMSSMTDEEKMEYNDIVKNTIDFYNCPKSEEICFLVTPIDWLNAHHFDYRGLIEKDLALEASKGMYNIEEK